MIVSHQKRNMTRRNTSDVYRTHSALPSWACSSHMAPDTVVGYAQISRTFRVPLRIASLINAHGRGPSAPWQVPRRHKGWTTSVHEGRYIITSPTYDKNPILCDGVKYRAHVYLLISQVTRCGCIRWYGFYIWVYRPAYSRPHLMAWGNRNLRCRPQC